MMQVLSILWRDIRHLWAELSVYMLLLLVFGVVIPQTWPGSEQGELWGLFAMVLKALLPISWLVLITRVIHADSLVGEEQFWITRPYHWAALLVAKCGFVAACVVVPFVLMQAGLLLAAGLSPLSAIGGAGVSIVKFSLIVWLPFMLAASITDSLATAFTLLASVMLIWGGLLTFLLTGAESAAYVPYTFLILGITFGVLLSGVLIYQYASRNRVRSVGMLVVTMILFVASLYSFASNKLGFLTEVLVHHRYLDLSDSSVRLVFDNATPHSERVEDMKVPGNAVEIRLPLEIQGLPQDVKISESSVAVTILSRGVRYVRPWQVASIQEHTMSFLLPREVFAQVKGQLSDLQVDLRTEKLKRTIGIRLPLNGRREPDVNANCIESKEQAYCRFPYELSSPTKVEAIATNEPCEVPRAKIGQPILLKVVPPGTNPDPVVTMPLHLQEKACPGMTVLLTRFGSAERIRLKTLVKGVELSAYQAQ